MPGTFDTHYAGKQSYYGLSASEELADFVAAHPDSKGTALDLGCGEGRDSIFLARHGFKVTSVDRSQAGIKKLAAIAREHGLPIVTVVEDVAAHRIEPSAYDMICLVTILDHLSRQDSARVSRRVCEGLKAGGVVFAEVFTTKDPGFAGGKDASETAEFVCNYFEPGGLRALFSSLQIEFYEEKDEMDTSHGPPHRHNVAVLIARRSA
jgi:tellurite methyltransferase